MDLKLIQYYFNNGKYNIFDIGSHKGESIDKYLKINKNLSIFSFEPDKENYNFLTKKFNDKKNIKIYNTAVGNSNRVVDFYMSSRKDVGSIINFPKYNLDNKISKHYSSEKFKLIKTEKKNLITLDNFCINNNIEHIDYMKIDVEGAEPLVIEGCIDMIKNHKISIIEVDYEYGYHHNIRTNIFDHEKYLIPNNYNLIHCNKSINFLPWVDKQVEGCNSGAVVTMYYVEPKLYDSIKKKWYKNNE